MADILIVGSGAMALLFGSRLAASSQQVTLLGTWQEGIQAINQSGIQVFGDQQKDGFPARGVTDLSELPPVKLALFLVKSWQTERAAKQLAQILDPDGIVLSLQNGLGNIEILGEILGKGRVAMGVTTYGATLIGPGVVRPGGEGVISIQDHPGLDPLINCLKQSGFSVQVEEDLSGLIWSKLIINVAINPLTALLNVNNGQLLDNKYSKVLMSLAAQEARNVARALEIEPGYEYPVSAVEAVAAATADNISSMLQDIRRGAPTEIDAMCGAVLRAGMSVNLKTPVNEIMLLLIQARESITRIIENENSDNLE
jgi:2-dehydropantoate 2-reductase